MIPLERPLAQRYLAQRIQALRREAVDTQGQFAADATTIADYLECKVPSQDLQRGQLMRAADELRVAAADLADQEPAGPGTDEAVAELRATASAIDAVVGR